CVRPWPSPAMAANAGAPPTRAPASAQLTPGSRSTRRRHPRSPPPRSYWRSSTRIERRPTDRRASTSSLRQAQGERKMVVRSGKQSVRAELVEARRGGGGGGNSFGPSAGGLGSFGADDYQQNAAGKHGPRQNRRQRNRLLLLGGRLDRTDVDHLLARLVGDALIGKTDDPEHDQRDTQ